MQKNFYNKLSIPVTIMSGNEDTVTPNSLHSYQLNSEIKQSKLVKVANVAHSIIELKPNLIKNEIEIILENK